MKNILLKAIPFVFLAMLFIVFSSNGQFKNPVPTEKSIESKLLGEDQVKLLKTQSKNPGDNVHCSIQDKEGNLWFGTTGDGVFKYDGKSFSQFATTNGLNSNTVHCILEDKDGKIWIGTAAGLCLYDGKIFSTVQITLPGNMPSNKYNTRCDVFSIMQLKSGKLWFATIDGVYIYDGKSFSHFIVYEGVGGFMSSNNNVEYMLEDKDGNIWFGGRVNQGVFRYNGKSITNLKPNGDNWAWPVLQDKNGNIWFSNWNGAYRYNGKSFLMFAKNQGLPGDMVARITEDKKEIFGLGVIVEFAAMMENLLLIFQQKMD